MSSLVRTQEWDEKPSPFCLRTFRLLGSDFSVLSSGAIPELSPLDPTIENVFQTQIQPAVNNQSLIHMHGKG